MRPLVISTCCTAALVLAVMPAQAQDGEDDTGSGDGRGEVDRSSNTAEGIDRVGNLGVGIADNNPKRNVTGGGIPCGTTDTCDLGGGNANTGGDANSGTAPTGPAGDRQAAAPPPPPPTHSEIVATTCPPAPTPDLRHNPREFGITGFHTWQDPSATTERRTR